MTIEPILDISIKNKASDIHFMPGLQPLMRVDGVLVTMKDIPVLTPEMAKELIYGLMTKEQQETYQTHLVIEMAVTVPNIGNFRVSAFHQLHGHAAVFRVIPEKIPSFDELGLPPVLKSLLSLSYGLILVTGATSSGKSTTLAAMIDYINSFRSCNIITIEDPIEFVYQNKRSIFNQLQVGRDTTDFASALRASLRQDPNVILIGELRDLETMRLALTAAETGHLVMATLHSSSAAIAVNRFVDVFPTEEKNRVRNLLSESLQGVLCQTLVKKTAGGRIAAFEVMLSTPSIRNFIRQDMLSHIESAMQTNGDKGMFTLEQYLHELVQSHVIKDTVADSIIANKGIQIGSKSTKKK